MPVAFADRPTSVRLLLVFLIPVVLGVIAGAVLTPVAAVYIAIQVLAGVGGIVAGLEHRSISEATVRGFTAGLGFGTAILLTHLLLGGDDHHLLGTLPLLLPWITAVVGAVFAIVGSLVRRRLEA